jgi:hypothetical protein
VQPYVGDKKAKKRIKELGIVRTLVGVRAVTPGGCQSGCMDHAGCRHRMCVLAHNIITL